MIEAAPNYEPSTEDKKAINMVRSELPKLKKPDNCLFCSNTKIVSSHTIPRSILEFLAGSDGHLLTTDFFSPSFEMHEYSITSYTLNPVKRGIKDTMLFRLLCSDCDVNLFSDYENRLLEKSLLNQHMLKEIALKTSLFELSELMLRKEILHKEIKDNISSNSFTPKELETHIKEVNREIKELKNELDSDKDSFEILYESVLEFITPITAQGLLFVKDTPNDSFSGISMDPDAKKVYVAVIPVKSGFTKVSLFTKDKRVINEWVNKKYSDEKVSNWIWNYLLESVNQLFIASPYSSSKFIRNPKNNPLNEDFAINKEFLSGTILWKDLLNARDSVHFSR